MPVNPDYEYVYDYEYDENLTIPEYYDPETEQELILLITRLADWLYTAQFVFAGLGLILNVPHFLVLVHKKMRTSSINIMMIGVAFCDIYIMVHFARLRAEEFFFLDFCSNSETYSGVLVSLISDLLLNVFLRVSAWLGLMTALIRLLVISFPLNVSIGKLSNKPTGVKVLVAVLLISLPVSAFNYARMAIVRDGKWKPGKKCGYPKGYSETQYTVVIGRRVLFSTTTSNRIHLIIKGACNIIPAICYPILAILLVLQFWKIDKKRNQWAGQRKNNETQNTTKFVILMTISFSLCQFPLGIDTWLQVYYENNPVIGYLLEYGSVLSTTLFTLNATIHCVMFVSMSSQYREVAKQVLCRRKSGSTV